MKGELWIEDEFVPGFGTDPIEPRSYERSLFDRVWDRRKTAFVSRSGIGRSDFRIEMKIVSPPTRTARLRKSISSNTRIVSRLFISTETGRRFLHLAFVRRYSLDRQPYAFRALVRDFRPSPGHFIAAAQVRWNSLTIEKHVSHTFG